jgi:thiamine biosynthesis lipoprotein
MAATNQSKVFHSNFYAMGTRMDVVLPNIDSEEGDAIFQSIRLEVKRLEKKLSRFDENSLVFQLNKKAATEAVRVDNELFHILKDCKLLFDKSNGYFDITQRKLMDYWKSDERKEDELQLLVNQLGTDKIALDEEYKTVWLANELVEIDLGGYGKGYALENVKTILTEHSVVSAFISFGESSVLTMGTHPYGSYWGVGIRNLYVNTENAYTFKIVNKSVSTSGVTPLKKGSEWGHVINPKSGLPVQGAITVSVSASSPLEAEVVSTALLISESSENRDIIPQFSVDEIISITYFEDSTFKIDKVK